MSSEFKSRKQLCGEIETLCRRVKHLEAIEALHQQAKQTLQESEKKYRTIFENTGTATILIKEDTTISMLNSEFEHLSGLSREEIKGKRCWTEFIARGDLKRMKTYHHTRRIDSRAAPRNYECKFITSKGELKNCFLTVGVIPGTKLSVASFMDITERIKTEEALRNSEEKFSKAFRSSPVAILISTFVDGRFVDVNKSFLNLTGYGQKEIIGYTANEIKLWPSPSYRENLIQMLKEEESLHNLEVEIRIKSGEMLTALMSAEIIYLQGQVCMLSLLVDITDQRRLEKEILKICERERQQIGQDLHDDLGQHLIGIEAMSTLLQHRLEHKSDPEAPLAKEISVLVKEAITKTRSLARGLCPVYLDDSGLVSALHEFSVHIKKVFGISCILNCDKDIKIKDNTTATHLYHIVQEAVNNAVRHGKAKQINISLTSKQNIITLLVQDNGVGIQKKPDNKKGLGLNIMKHRAKKIGATLEVRGKKEGGTSVRCSLKQRF